MSPPDGSCVSAGVFPNSHQCFLFHMTCIRNTPASCVHFFAGDLNIKLLIYELFYVSFVPISAIISCFVAASLSTTRNVIGYIFTSEQWVKSLAQWPSLSYTNRMIPLFCVSLVASFILLSRLLHINQGHHLHADLQMLNSSICDLPHETVLRQHLCRASNSVSFGQFVF